ncbi:hypothetical protein [Halarcobacter ebronensis]|uniref:Uncharacterized protein n=1 Tax=Halarcobacter ebronensis TaxID=1462615 RepID=A0A4Q1AWL9_9BACT|nr:hypothetical protein [Halarcobacter ebronensis]QKF82838.1 hypothetical protein AEBR_2370 [Halarcobacter ebronensis]RXK06859.1 hypothetical protein CRV07_05360 [Halarcobacter ebronensis]
MERLRYIEDDFDNLSTKVKIELYLFPFLLLLLLAYFISENSSFEKKIDIQPLTIENIKMKKSFIEISKEIEEYAKKSFITLQSIKNSDNNIEIVLYENLKKRVEFIKYLELYNSFSKIDSITIDKNLLSVKIVFDRFYKKEPIDIKAELESISPNNNKFLLKAIVGKYAYINETWLKQEERIDNYKVESIGVNEVHLRNKYSNLVLKLYENE